MTEAELLKIEDNEEFLKALAATLSPALRERVVDCADSLGSYAADDYDRQQGDGTCR
jgi:hypothetical protein